MFSSATSSNQSRKQSVASSAARRQSSGSITSRGQRSGSLLGNRKHSTVGIAATRKQSRVNSISSDQEREYHKHVRWSKHSLNGSGLTNQIVDINISGEVFQTYLSTLERFPDTLLGDRTRREEYRNRITGQYFFDRNSEPFEAILYYYQSEGTLECPENMDLELFINELLFFDIGDKAIESFQIENGLKEPPVVYDYPEYGPFRVLWGVLEYPETSTMAKVFAMMSVLVITASLVMFVAESVPGFGKNQTTRVINQTTSGSDGVAASTQSDWMFQINTAIIVWFTAEFLLRFTCCPRRLNFFFDTGNIIDFLSILPYYVGFLVSPTGDGGVVSILRVVRVLRTLKFARYSRGLQILGNTLSSSFNDLMRIGFFLFVMVLIFGSCAYYAENHVTGTKFTSIPNSAWWVVVTMTTVGYGDMAPKTVLGKLIGGMAAIGGVLTMSLPVPVVVAKFEYFYTKEKNRKKNEETRRNEERNEGRRRTRSLLEKCCVAGGGGGGGGGCCCGDGGRLSGCCNKVRGNSIDISGGIQNMGNDEKNGIHPD